MATLRKDSSEEPLSTTQELVQRTFSRCSNYPNSSNGVTGLVEALDGSAHRFGCTPEAITRQWASQSAYCPTDFEVIKTGMEIFDRRKAQEDEAATRNQDAKWRKQYGEPKKFEWTEADSAATRKIHAERDEMWRKIRKELGVKGDRYPWWPSCIAAARKLGYNDYANAWESGLVPAPDTLPKRATAGDALEIPVGDKAPMGCEICKGSGWQSFQRIVSPVGVVPYVADFADHCICELGRWRKARESELKAEKAAKAVR